MADPAVTDRKETAIATDPEATSPDSDIHLRILATSDLHCHIWPFDYTGDTDQSGFGLAGAATAIAAARADAPNCLLFDVGDILQGSALADLAATGELAGAPHPMITAMNALDYDGATLGNHDFNYGLDLLDKVMGEARFPFVSANILRARGAEPVQDRGLAMLWTILERRVTDAEGRGHNLRIGLIGAAPPQSVTWDSVVLGDALSARDIVAALRPHVCAIRDAGADLVVLLSHSGLGDAVPDDGAENATRAAAALAGVDVVLAGHSHLRLPGPDFEGLSDVDAAAGLIHGKPAAMPGAHGSDLVRIDLHLTPAGESWRIARSETRLDPLGEVPPDPAILRMTEPSHTAARAAMQKGLGRTAGRLHAVLAHAGHAPALQMAAEAQAWRARPLIAGTDLADLPLISVVSPFKLGGGRLGARNFVDIPEGVLCRRHLVDLAPFPNKLCVVAVTGADLRRWLERVASAYLTIPKGAVDADLWDPNAPAYNFDVLFGLDYTFDISRPPGFDPADGRCLDACGPGRLCRAVYDGQEVTDDQVFAVATNSYRAALGGGFTMLRHDARKMHSDEDLRQIMIDYIAEMGTIDITPSRPWHFAPIGSTAVVRSAPWADLALHGDPSVDLTPLEPDQAGFSRFRLRI